MTKYKIERDAKGIYYVFVWKLLWRRVIARYEYNSTRHRYGVDTFKEAEQLIVKHQKGEQQPRVWYYPPNKVGENNGC